MDDLIIIFIYTKKDEVTKINLSNLKQNNPYTKIIDICQDDFADYHFHFLDAKPIRLWSSHDIWYWGSDNIFLYWYLVNQNIRAKNYLILEWDTFSYHKSVVDFFGERDLLLNTGIKAINYIRYKDDPFYHWFREQKNNRFIKDIYTYDNFACCTPLCGTLLHDSFVEAVINHLKNNPYANKFYVESKFATLANFLKFPVNEYINNYKYYISYSEGICDSYLTEIENNSWSKNGIYHPIKKINTLRRFFMPINLNNSRIHKAMYGKLVDVKPAIEKLQQLNPDENIHINNFLGGDPAPGVGKYLYLTYEKNGQIFETTIPENEILDIKKL